MQHFRLRIVLVTFLLFLTVITSNKTNVWASPERSLHGQTVPTRVRTPTPVDTPTSLPTADTPTVGSNPAPPTNTKAPGVATFPLPTPSQQIIPTQTPAKENTASQFAPSVTFTPSAIPATLMLSTLTAVSPEPIPTPNRSSGITGRLLSLIIGSIIVVIFLVVIIGVLVFVVRKRPSR
jgi:hypothetical protein